MPGVESLLVVINPDADGADEHKVQEAIDALRAEADVQVQVCRTAMPGDLDGALQRRGGRTVVVAGDDRHLHTVVAALHRRNELDDTLLALVPGGSGTDFADAYGIPTDPTEAAHAVIGGVERRFDLLVDCRGSVIVNAVRLGRCQPPRLAPRVWTVGRAALSEHGPMPALERPVRRQAPVMAKPLHVRIEADDSVVADFDRPVLSVAVNNVPSPDSQPRGPASLGGQRSTADEADPADGFADVVVHFAVDSLSRLRRQLRPSSEAEERDDVVKVRARRVSVVGQRFWLSCDGQDSGSEQRCTWQVAPSSLRMVVPKSA